jgi:iron complex outermembrane receptor protein
VNLGYPAAYAAALRMGYHETTSSIRQFSRTRSYTVSNVTTIDLSDTITLKNVAGWRKYSARDGADQDGTSVPVSTTSPARTGARQYSEELQLQGKSLDAKLDWIVGGFWFNEKGYDSVDNYTLRTPYVSAYTVNDFGAENSSRSVFGHASYTLPFATRVRIYGGARYTWDKRDIPFRNRAVSITGVITCSVAGATNANCALPGQVKFSKLTWEAGADIQPTPDSLVYATVSTGYRSGGFNGRATTVDTQAPFKLEKVTNYELGFKSAFDQGTGRLSFSAAVYQSKYRDIQRNVIRNIAPPGETPRTVSTTVNAASATIKGFEFEMTARASERFQVNGRISYVRPRYDSFPVFNPRIGQVVDASDNRFYGVAPVQFGAGFNWVMSDGDAGTVSLASDFSYSDKFQLNDLNVPGGQANSSTVVNASVAWENMLGSRVTGTLYVKSLTNDKCARPAR